PDEEAVEGGLGPVHVTGGLVGCGAMAKEGPMRTERSPGGGRASPPDPAVAVEYLRKLEDSLRSWYQAADTKAQVALTLNGVFLGFVAGSILTNRGDVARTVTDFGPETWGLLAAMAAGCGGGVRAR